MPDDKKTIGMTSANKAYVNALVSGSTFASELDAARFAMALAIKNGDDVGSVSGADTTWNQGSFDPTGEIAKLIKILVPSCETPYRMMEILLNKGFDLMRSAGDANDLDIRDLMGGND